MGANNYIPNGENTWQILQLEKRMLEKHFAFLKVSIVNGILICKGWCQPSELSKTYHYKIKFTPGKTPKVYVTEPEIEYNSDIHMYHDDNRLCLYYPKDYSFMEGSHLYNTIVPWTHEWFVFYELYQITGKWLHPFVAHNNI